MTPSSSVYTATRDLFFNNLTFSGGAILETGGFIICINGTLSGTGTIRRNGNNGGNSPAAGTGGGAGASKGATYYCQTAAGGAGGPGGAMPMPAPDVTNARYINPGTNNAAEM